MCNRQAACVQPCTQALHLGWLLRYMWSRSSSWPNLDHWHLEEICVLWSENKWRVRFYSRTKLPTSEDFLSNSRTPQLTYRTGNHVFYCMLLSLLKKGKVQGFFLNLAKDPASNTGLSLFRESLTSNSFSTSLSSYLIALFRAAIHWKLALGTGYE